MPRPYQIIPQYTVPHVMTVINDNTQFQEQTSPREEGVRFVCVFMSSKGRDRKLIAKDNKIDYISEFGNPNYELYGQPGYMPVAALNQPDTKVWCMRITPDDATYSNIVLIANIKEGSGVTPPTVVYESKYIANATTKELLLEGMAATEQLTPDANGFIKLPLAMFNISGRGVYGNTHHVGFAPAIQADKDNGLKNYRLELYSSESGYVRLESFVGSFVSDAMADGSTKYLESIVSDSDRGSSVYELTIDQMTVQHIYKVYRDYVDTTAETPVDILKFPFLESIDDQFIVKYESDASTGTLEPIDPFTVTGINFDNGTDGIFADYSNPTGRDAAIIKAYTDAFRGKFDKSIRSKRARPAEFILDANYPKEVKTELIGLIGARGDCYGIVDAGIIRTQEEALNWGIEMQTYGAWQFGKEFQHYKVRDSYTGKIITVTSTYNYIGRIANHIKTYGLNTPFVNDLYARVTGQIKNSMMPDVDEDDMEFKEALYTMRLNFYSTLNENNYVRYTQSTSQNIWSDLTEESNVFVVLNMKRRIDDALSKKFYSFAEPEQRQEFTDMVERMFADYRGRLVRDFTVEFNASPYEETRSILHCYLGITFRSIVKRFIVEIDINRRVAAA